MPRGYDQYDLPPPLLGVKQDDLELRIPLDYTRESFNMVSRRGKLEVRPGIVKVRATAPSTSKVIGGITFKTMAGVAKTVAATRTTWWSLGASSWADLTDGVALTAGINDQARFQVFPSAGVNLLIGVNNVDTPKSWDGAAATFLALAGSPPSTARDVTAVANYVILGNVIEGGVRYTSRLRISAFNNPISWSATSADVNGTEDDIVGIRRIGRAAFAIYKDYSVWTGVLQAGTFPFAFDLITEVSGPCSPSSIVTYDGGKHCYLGNDARLYVFDGLAVTPVSGQVDQSLVDDLKGLARVRSWGMYRRADRMVWFLFPFASDDPDRGVSYHIDSGAVQFHNFGKKLTAGWRGDDIAALGWNDLATFTWANIAATYPTWESFGGKLLPIEYLGELDGQVYFFKDNADDDGTPITVSWATPLQAWAGEEKMHSFDAIESSFEQVTGGPAILVQIGTSAALAEPKDPTYITVGTHDTTLATRQLMKASATNRDSLVARLQNVRFSGSVQNKRLNYRGSELFLYDEEVGD